MVKPQTGKWRKNGINKPGIMYAIMHTCQWVKGPDLCIGVLWLPANARMANLGGLAFGKKFEEQQHNDDRTSVWRGLMNVALIAHHACLVLTVCV